MPVTLVEFDAFVDGQVQTLRYGTRGVTTSPTENPPNVYYSPRVSDPGAFERGIRDGASEVDIGALLLVGVDGRIDPIFGYGVDSRKIVIRDYDEVRGQPSTAPIIFQGVLDRVDTSDAWREVRLVIRDRLSDLEKPLITETFAGTTNTTGPTAEGTIDIKDRVKPRVWGNVQFMAPVLANPFDLIFLASNSAVASIKVYDGGNPLLSVGDYPTIAALRSTTMRRGEYGTCLATGHFRLGGPSLSTTTCDVVEGATLADRSSARIIERMLTAYGLAPSDRLQSTFNALHAKNPAEIGILVESTTTTARATISEVLAAVGAAIVPTTDSKLQIVFQDVPAGEPVAYFGIRDLIGKDNIDLQNDGIPRYKQTVEYGRIWQTLGENDIAGTIRQNDPARAATLKEPIRTAVATDETIRVKHPQAEDNTSSSFFVQRADAEARAAELLTIEGMQRLKMEITVPAFRAPPSVSLGTVVRVTLPRFGLDAGKLFRVERRRDDFRRRTVTLTVWR